MTPYQLGLCADGQRDRAERERKRDLWVLWHAEALRRMDKLPQLHELTGGEPPKKKIDEAAIKARFKAYRENRK